MAVAVKPGGLAAEEPGDQAEGGPQRRGTAAQEEAHRHDRLHPRPAQEHALEAPGAAGTPPTPTHTHTASFH